MQTQRIFLKGGEGGEKNLCVRFLWVFFRSLRNGWGSNLFMCCLFLGNKETHKQISQEISGKCRDSPGIILEQSREILVYVFFFQPSKCQTYQFRLGLACPFLQQPLHESEAPQAPEQSNTASTANDRGIAVTICLKTTTLPLFLKN